MGLVRLQESGFDELLPGGVVPDLARVHLVGGRLDVEQVALENCPLHLRMNQSLFLKSVTFLL